MYTTVSNDHNVKPRALVAEDDWYTANMLESIFKREGYEVVVCKNGADAMHQLTYGGPYDIALLDVVMPKMSGLEVLRQAREAGIAVPVMIVSGRTKEHERINGLVMGADDYIVKPFSTRELLARTAAVRRRCEIRQPLPKRIRMGDVLADFETFSAMRGAEAIHFTPLEWGVLRHMAYREGRAVSRQEFNVHVLKIPASIETRTIDRHAYALRYKIDKNPKQPHHILAVKGIGYRLNDFEHLA